MDYGAGLRVEPATGSGGVGASSTSIMRFVANSELDALRDATKQKEQQILSSLSAHVQRQWEEARRLKNEIEEDMLRDYRQRQGIYDPKTLSDIREQGGSEIYVMLTSIKCEALVAWLCDIEFQPDENAWALSPSPIPELPPELELRVRQAVAQYAHQAFSSGAVVDLQQLQGMANELREEVRERLEEEATQASERMEQVIEDDLINGDWETAIREAIDDMATTKAGIVHGPVFRKRKRLRWVRGPDGYKPDQAEEIIKTYERVSPFDIYPLAGATNFDDGGFFHHQRLPAHKIEAMIGVDGFDDEEIRAALTDYRAGGLKDWLTIDTQRNEIEQRPNQLTTGGSTIDVLSYWDKLSGQMLIDHGVDYAGLDPNKEYDVNVWQIGRHTIGVMIESAPMGKRPYSKVSFRKVPGAFWGEGLAHEIRDAQMMCNSSAREISNNSGMASGPQVVINDGSRVPPNEDITQPYPWKVWQFGPDRGATGHRPPIEFFQPNPMTDSLLKVFDKFSSIADAVSGVPNYAYGDSKVGGAGQTASGLSMLMSSASRGIKDVIKRIDSGLIQRTVWQTFVLNMLYHPDRSIKGDLHVEVRGSSSLIAKEQQQIRRQEFLSITNNPTDLQIMGLAGRARVLREAAKSLDLPIDEIVPDPNDLEARAQQGQLQIVIDAVSQAFGVHPDQVMQLVQQYQQQAMAQQGGQGMMQDPSMRAIDPAGNPVSGQDVRLFG